MADQNRFDGSLNTGLAAFVAETGRDKYWEKVKDEYRKFIDPATGLLWARMARHRDCPVCGANDFRTAFVKDGFTHGVCRCCTFFYVDPILSEECLNQNYSEDPGTAAWIDVLLSETQRAFDGPKFLDGAERITKHRGGVPGRIVDIGCSIGHFLEKARGIGWKTVGLELNKRAVAHARSLGLEVIEDVLTETLFPEGSFEAATLWEVLEHVSEPRSVLAGVRRILTPGGVLLILVPNIDSLAIRVMHAASATFGGEAHINLFGPRTLRRVLEEEGFEILEMRTIVSEVGPLLNHLGFEDPYGGPAAPFQDWLTADFLHEHLIGYKLMAIARKI